MVMSLDKIWTLNGLKWKTLGFFALSGNFIGWKLQNLHMNEILLEVSTHMSPKLPIGRLLSRWSWKTFFHLCIRSLECWKQPQNYVPWVDTLIGWNCQKWDLWWLFFVFSEDDLKKHLKFSTLLQSTNKLTAEISGGIDFCRKSSENIFETVFCSFNWSQKLIKNFVSRQKLCRY